MPLQLPLSVVSVEPTWTVPVMVGGSVFDGAEASVITAVGAEVASAGPSAFSAVTVTRRVWPMSSCWSW